MSKGKTLLPDPYPLSPSLRAWADMAVPTLDVDYYHDEFCDHWYGNGKLMKSWDATWKNWMRRTDRGAGPGMFGPDDRSIQRKRPKPVPQGEMDLQPPTPISPHQAWRDYLSGIAMSNGVYVGNAPTQEIIDKLEANGIEYDNSKRPSAAGK